MAAWKSRLLHSVLLVIFLTNLETANTQREYCSRPVPCQVGEVQPDPGNCRKYYECNRGGGWKNPSCSRRQYFDSVNLKCVAERDATCAPACDSVAGPAPVSRDPCVPPPLPCTEASVEQEYRDCSKFFHCVNGEWTERACQPSYKFNLDLQRCVPDDESLCEETCTLIDEPPELPDFPNPRDPNNPPVVSVIPPVITPIPEFTVTPYAPTGETITETVIQITCNTNLDCDHLSRFPNPLDCTNFFMCVEGMRVLQPCMAGRFDAISLKCVINNQETCFPPCETFYQTTQREYTLPDLKQPTDVPTTLMPQPDAPSQEVINRLWTLACNLPQSCSALRYIPIPGNCSAFYRCDYLSSRTYKVDVCKQGQQFDVSRQSCVASAAALCMPSIPCPQNTSPPDPKTSSEITTAEEPADVTTASPTKMPPAQTDAPLPQSSPRGPILPPVDPTVVIPVNVTVPPVRTKDPVVTVRPTRILKTTTIPEMCEPSKDSSGLQWTSIMVGQEIELPCVSSLKGNIIRRCILGTGGLPTWEDPVSFCVDPPYLEILNLTQSLEVVSGNKSSLQMTNEISEKLRDIILADLQTKNELSPGNLNASMEALLTLSRINIYGVGADPDIVQHTMTNLAVSLDDLLSPNNTNAWDANLKRSENCAVSALNATDNIGKGIASTLPKGTSKNISLANFAIKAVSLPENQTTAVSFSVDVSEGAPLLQLNYSSTDSSIVLDSIEVQPETLRTMAENAGTESLVMWTTYHSRLDMLMPATKNMIINSRILALTVDNLQSGFTFHPPITLRFTPLNKTLVINETFCSYWKYTSMTSGYWSQEGCELKSNSTNLTSCECDHLTNFAVLVSPYLAEGKHARILSLISLIGCLLSILGCFGTMVFYTLAWKEVKSQHAVVLMNLCAVLIIANVIFLVGIDKVQYEAVCTAVAALLHYFWLVAFMVMLADGVMFILYVVYVFHIKRKRETVLLLLTAYIVPAIIVGVTLGVTRTKGYGTNEYCWLERTSGLIAAFIAPVAVIIIANFGVLIKVLHTAATSKSNEHKNRSRLVAVVWNIMVVLPLLGIAWIFGLLSVNEKTIAFQYVFAIANSLQGFFIFIFHCALNKKLRNGVSSRFSFRGSTTSSMKSNKSNKSANIRNAQKKAKNGFLHENRKVHEEKVF